MYSIGCSYRDILERWMQGQGVRQSVIMEFGTLEAIVGGVSAGLGISLLPRTVVTKHAAEGAVHAHEVPESIRHMRTEFITRKDSFISSALHALIDLMPRASAQTSTDMVQ